MEVLSVISESLVLLNKLVPDQATKLANKILEHREKWGAEYAKKDLRDDNLLDVIESELRDIRALFSNAISSAASKD